jgi:hypothetical protein
MSMKPAKAPSAPPVSVKTREPPPGGRFDENGILRPIPPKPNDGLPPKGWVNGCSDVAPGLRDGPGGYLGLAGGGSSGFAVNGNLLTGRKPLAGIPDGVPGQTVGLLNRPRPK